MRSYAKIKDWHIYSIYADEGISAKDIDGRPEIKRMIADIVSGKITNVLVYKIDRLTRSTKNLIELIDLFNKHDCAFNSLNESIDTSSATGRMFLKIVGIFAEFERENLAERVRLGFERKAREGYTSSIWIQSYGYNRENGNKVQDIFPEEAAIVRRIFSMYLHDDYAINKIQKILNVEKIPTKKHKKWATTTIKQILTNPTYIGKVRYATEDANRYFEADGKHEPIISEAMYYEVQEKLQKIKGVTRTKRPRSGVYYCGVLYCKSFGRKYTTKWSYSKDASKNAIHPYYRCANALEGDCSNKNIISHSKVEKAFQTYIANIENFSEIENTDTNDAQDALDNTTELETIAAEIAQIERKANEVMVLFMENQIEFDAYQQMVKHGSEKREELTARLNLLENLEASRESRYSKQEILANIRENWQELDNEHRLQFVQKFIKKIVIHKEPSPDVKFGIAIVDNIEFNEF